MELRLLVIRTQQPQRLADFYRLLGLQFEYHQHGNSPYHYSSTIGPTVLEIYPLAKNQAEADKTVRLGFALDDFEKTMEVLKQERVSFLAEPAQTDFGFLAIIEDPDHRKVELYKSGTV